MRAALTVAELAAARAEGAAKGAGEVVAYALDERPALDVSAGSGAAAAAASEGAPCPPPVPALLVAPPMPITSAHLTAREATVLHLITAGRSNKEIAREMSISLRTVEHHITNLYQKIAVQSKAEATAYALRYNLDQSPE